MSTSEFRNIGASMLVLPLVVGESTTENRWCYDRINTQGLLGKNMCNDLSSHILHKDR